MTTQPAGEHHTGTLELAGQGNPQQTTARDILAEQLWSEVWDSERPYDEANDPERAACEAATDRVLAVLEPAIRQQVAEQIAAELVRRGYGQTAARMAREIGGQA